MPNKLTDADYKTIILHYKENLPKSAKLRKKRAERLMADKLCSCIKKITKSSKKNKSRSIGICTYSVIKNRGMKFKKFSCKKKKLKKLQKTRKIKFKRPYRTRRRKGGRIRSKDHKDGLNKIREERKEEKRQEREEIRRRIAAEEQQKRVREIVRRLQEEQERLRKLQEDQERLRKLIEEQERLRRLQTQKNYEEKIAALQ
jgi:hypothetical protein